MKIFNYLIFILILLGTMVSCAKKPSAKQHFSLRISALQTGLALNGGSFVHAISSTSNSIVKLDADNSAVFEFGIWEFQVVSFQGPNAFLGKRYCGRVQNFNLKAITSSADLVLTEANCLSVPFVDLILEINTKFNPTPAPSISSLSFNGGLPSGGTLVTINGSHFSAGMTVTFDGVPCTSLTYINSTSMTCLTPAHSAGAVNVVVTAADSQFGIVANAFTYQLAATVSSLNPNVGDLSGGTPVTITGSGFISGATISIGGSACTRPVVVSSTIITCTTPAHAEGAVSIVVTNTDLQAGSLTSAFTYQDMLPPDVSGMAFIDGISEWSTAKTPMFSWNAATDTSSGVAYYEIALGTTKGGTEVQNWMNVGNVISYQFSGLSLTRGNAYYASIKATDNKGNTSSVVQGDGWFVTNEMWITDNLVRTMIQSGSTLYLGGDFTSIAPWSGGGVPLNTSTGLMNWPTPSSKARVSGIVSTSIPDGLGGFYIGGSFQAVGGIVRNNLAHILADGSVDPNWSPNMNGPVYALAVLGSTLYAGGDFTTVNGSTKNRLAEIDLVTGNATSWEPNMNNIVRALAISGSTLYAGGDFTTIGSSTARNRLAAFDLLTLGNLTTSWNPNMNGPVYALAMSGSTLYAGGAFSAVNGSTNRNRLAAIDLTIGIATDWNPNLNLPVRAMAISGSTLYVGGDFDTVNGSTRNRLAAFDLGNGMATSWNPNMNTYVRALAISGSTLYAGGDFTTIGGSSARSKLAAFDLATGNLTTSWNPNMNGSVYALAMSGSTLYAGGAFSAVNGSTTRNRLAAIDLVTGNLASWDPNMYGTSGSFVQALAISGSTLYVGGFFTAVNGSTPRNYLAALALDTGIATSWNPNMNSYVGALTISGNTLYAGGAFTLVNGSTRNRLAAFDLATGNLTGWNPNINDSVHAMAISGSTLYAGGAFSMVNGSKARSRLAEIALDTGIATNWDPTMNNIVYALAISGNSLYVGGTFSTVNGSTPRNNLAAINLATGTATSWDPNMNNNVRALAISGSTLYAGGDFNTIGGSSARSRLAAFDLATGNLTTSWNPNMNDSVFALIISGSTLYAGGKFTAVNPGGSGQLAPIDTTTGLWLPGF